MSAPRSISVVVSTSHCLCDNTSSNLVWTAQYEKVNMVITISMLTLLWNA